MSAIEKPRILMFAPLCYPPAGSEAIVTSKLLLAMIEAGWHIDVISQADFGLYYPVSSYGTWDAVKNITHNIAGIKKGGLIDKLRNLPGLTLIGKFRTLSWVIKAFFTARKLSRIHQYDFILSRAAPQYGHLPALLFSQWSKIPWIANWSDPMPPQKAPPPYGKGPNARIPLYLQTYCNLIAIKASWHTFPSARLQQYFCTYMPECRQKSSVIPHIALKRFHGQHLASNNNGFSLCHPGNLANRDPYVFLEGVRLFLETGKAADSFRLTFIGPALENLQEKSLKLKLVKMISIEDMKTYEETQDICQNSTVLVILEAMCDEGIFFPSKFVDFVQTGRPILAVSPTNGTLHDLLASYGGGLSADCTSPKAVASALEILYSEWQTGTLENKYSSSRLAKLFDKHQILALYRKIFVRLTSGGG